jgi:selenide,water dikinase
LEKLPHIYDPRIIVGFDTADDAGVVKISDELALVTTVDIFTPIVDDPYEYGRISAANSLSDVYAMGGKPLSALNIIGFPKGLFPVDVLAEVLLGGFDKTREADTMIVGGHSITDDEMKYGLAVTGLVHPQKVMTNALAKPGDVLVLTKPIGTGTITTALKAAKGTAVMEKTVIAVMTQLNRDASEIARGWKVKACTDITGYGLIGHALEMARASRVSLVFDYRDIPLIEGAEMTARNGFVPGGTKSNQLYVGADTIIDAKLGKTEQSLLFDPQTSGGLLLSVGQEIADKLLKEMIDRGISAKIVGYVQNDLPGKVIVT